MAKPKWIDACDDIVTALNVGSGSGSPYTGTISITDEAVRGYWPEFDGLDLRTLHVVASPNMIDPNKGNIDRCRMRSEETIEIAVHVIRIWETRADVDALLWLADDIIDIVMAKGAKWGGLSAVGYEQVPIFDMQAYENHRAVWTVPIFAMR